MAFNEAQVTKLKSKARFQARQDASGPGTTLAYVEGWHVIAEANRIFGYDAWDRQTFSTRCVWSGTASRHYAAAYTAKVRISGQGGRHYRYSGGLRQWGGQGSHRVRRTSSRSRPPRPTPPSGRSPPLAIRLGFALYDPRTRWGEKSPNGNLVFAEPKHEVGPWVAELSAWREA